MCRRTQYKFCSPDSGKAKLPPETVVRCAEWPILLSNAKKSHRIVDKQQAKSAAKNRINREIEKKENEGSAAVKLEAHIEETQKTTKVEVVHVSEVLPGGSCVPSRGKKVFWLEEKNKEQNMMYYQRCDGSYRADNGRLRPEMKPRRVRFSGELTGK